MLDEKTSFYVSYRRGDPLWTGPDRANKADEIVRQFHGKLCEDVGQLIALPRGHDLGFLDVEGMNGGSVWHPELLRALGSCQVLVALLSVPYLKSDWCGKEWHAFISRRKHVRNKNDSNQSSVIPILWTPIPGVVELPTTVADHINIFSPKSTKKNPDLPQRYSRDGLYRLVQAGEHDAVSEITWQVALLIQRVYYNQHLGTLDSKPENLINAFEGRPT